MKLPPTSVWLTALMAAYAAIFFAYEFGVRRVGLSARNIGAAAAAVALVVAVWATNRRRERRSKKAESDKQQGNQQNSDIK